MSSSDYSHSGTIIIHSHNDRNTGFNGQQLKIPDDIDLNKTKLSSKEFLSRKRKWYVDSHIEFTKEITSQMITEYLELRRRETCSCTIGKNAFLSKCASTSQCSSYDAPAVTLQQYQMSTSPSPYSSYGAPVIRPHCPSPKAPTIVPPRPSYDAPTVMPQRPSYDSPTIPQQSSQDVCSNQQQLYDDATLEFRRRNIEHREQDNPQTHENDPLVMDSWISYMVKNIITAKTDVRVLVDHKTIRNSNIIVSCDLLPSPTLNVYCVCIESCAYNSISEYQQHQLSDRLRNFGPFDKCMKIYDVVFGNNYIFLIIASRKFKDACEIMGLSNNIFEQTITGLHSYY